MGIDVTVELAYGDEKRTSTTRAHPLGAHGRTTDGREFRYCLGGGTAIEAGRLVQGFAPNSDMSGNATVFVTAGSTVASGVTTIAILPTTGVGANYGRWGFLMVQTSGAARASYKVLSQSGSGSSANAITLTLEEGDELIAPVTTAQRIALMRNPYSSVVVAPAALAAAIVGVTCAQVAASNYFWAQTKGPAPVEYNAGQQAATDGHTVQADTSVPGAFMGFGNSSTAPLTTGANSQTDNLDKPVIGWVDMVPADALLALVNLNLP